MRRTLSTEAPVKTTAHGKTNCPFNRVIQADVNILQFRASQQHYDSCFCITRHSCISGVGDYGGYQANWPSILKHSTNYITDGTKSHFHRLLHHRTASFTQGRMMFIQQTFPDNNNNPTRQWCSKCRLTRVSPSSLSSQTAKALRRGR